MVKFMWRVCWQRTHPQPWMTHVALSSNCAWEGEEKKEKRICRPFSSERSAVIVVWSIADIRSCRGASWRWDQSFTAQQSHSTQSFHLVERSTPTMFLPFPFLHLLSPPSFSCVLEEEQFYLQHQTCTPLQRPSSIGPRRASGLGPVARWPWYDAERFVQFVPTFLVKIMTEHSNN